jgi:uncharacterized protein YbcI
MKFEPVPKMVSGKHEVTAEDYENTPAIYNLLKQLPPALIQRHAEKIDNSTDEEVVIFLKDLLKKREQSLVISEISDPELQKHFQGREKEIFSYIENDLSVGDKHLLGEGATAKVKAYYFETSEVAIPMAVKYVFTPIEGTISAAEEHRVLIEVERMQIIEKIESGDIEKHKHVRVPHPYFQYDSGKIQCYGMELIKGLNLHEAIQGEWFDEEQKTKVREAIGHIPLEEIRKEFEIFIENMHQFCLHRDIKPANIMISEEGMFYLIDFGQSELVTNMHGKNPEQIASLKQDELRRAKDAISQFYHAVLG